MSARAPAAALASGVLLASALWAGEAFAQTSVCRGGAYSSGAVACTEASSSSDNIRFDPPNIPAAGYDIPGISTEHRGNGDIAIVIKSGIRILTGLNDWGVRAAQRSGGNIDVRMSGGSIATSGDNERGTALFARKGLATGNVIVALSGGSVRASGNQTQAVYVGSDAAAGGEVSFTMSGGTIETTGNRARGAYVYAQWRGAAQDAKFVMTGGAIRTTGGRVAQAPASITPFPWGASHAVYCRA